jgi:A/G-specific adenine glycosylase
LEPTPSLLLQRVQDATGTTQPIPEAIEWFQQRLFDWYAENQREFPWRGTQSTYALVVAEVLLQRTTARAAAAFLPGFLERYPTWPALADASIAELEETLRPVGLWRRRAASLHRLATVMVGSQEQLPPDHDSLEALPGIGQYMANAVSLVVRGEERPLLDSSMARVLERFFGPRRMADIRYDPYLQTLAHRVVATADPKMTNWAILDFAALVCGARRPECPKCPLLTRCRWGATVVGA